MADDPVATKPELSVRPTENADGIEIRIGDELFARMIPNSQGRPVIHPILGPGGQEMTRAFPFREAGPLEKDDHDHHRSMWLTHGEVNDVDFWIDDPGTGTIVQRSLSVIPGEPDRAVVTTRNAWKAPDGRTVCTDFRKWTFSTDGSRRIIDLDAYLFGLEPGTHFGDTKEGTFGLRVPGPMKVDAGRGGVIHDAEGRLNKDAWGKRAAWVDYNGPATADAQTPSGIRIHTHPETFEFPNRWHVRTYGLFAVNPFGVHHFVGGDKTDGVHLEHNESLKLSYRVVFYDGHFDANIAEEDQRVYAKTSRGELVSARD